MIVGRFLRVYFLGKTGAFICKEKTQKKKIREKLIQRKDVVFYGSKFFEVVINIECKI